MSKQTQELSPFERILMKAVQDHEWAELLLRNPEEALKHPDLGIGRLTKEQLIEIGKNYGPLCDAMQAFSDERFIG